MFRELDGVMRLSYPPGRSLPGMIRSSEAAQCISLLEEAHFAQGTELLNHCHPFLIIVIISYIVPKVITVRIINTEIHNYCEN